MPDGATSTKSPTFWDGAPPGWLRVIELRALMRVFARAFDVEAPRMRGLSASSALEVFRTFTAACMEMAADDARLEAHLRKRLGAGAQELGSRLRALLRVTPERALAVARYCYRGIGIELAGELPGELRFGPCFFAGRYTPRDCWCMSAFDEGFLQGLSGKLDAKLVFRCRLTEGAPCCAASFGEKGPEDGGRCG